MARRPGNLDLSGTNKAPSPLTSPRGRFHIDLPSPRVGEIPPALSPLDMFAQQSRMLAKRFEDSQQKGRRLSRLNHLEIADELARRPTYFRSISGVSQQSEQSQQSQQSQESTPEPEQRPAVEASKSNLMLNVGSTSNSARPVSHYPRFGSTGSDNVDDEKRFMKESDIYFAASQDNQPVENYFGFQVPRAASPEPYESRTARGEPFSGLPSLTGSVDSVTSSQIRTNTEDSTASRTVEKALIPPWSPHSPRSKKSGVSIRSVNENGDDKANLEPRNVSDLRKMSQESAISRPTSPLTPDAYPTCHSPSMGSARSVDLGHFQRPSFNFSRPLSSAGNTPQLSEGRPSLASKPSYESRPSFEFPQRQSSIDRARSPLGMTTDSPPAQTDNSTRISIEEPPALPNAASDWSENGEEDSKAGAPSYIYSKYSLPRGRTVERGSLGDRSSWLAHQFKYDQPLAESSPNTPYMTLNDDDEQQFRQPFAHNPRSMSADGHAPSTPKKSSHQPTPSSPSVISHSTDRTIRSHTRNSPSADIVNMSAEEHLEKGIECHSSGSLSKSTYHLRLAARAGHPTGMLLYALACRHGWGMRPNQQEGVQWLKRAVDGSSLDVMSDSALGGPLMQNDNPSKADKARKAQFALAIYELGISYMNGWGISKDKSLALRCFEIAGNWGDCDALAEAGFCYTQGVGCKKDLKKGAGLYRRAADMGMSMAGNSW